MAITKWVVSTSYWPNPYIKKSHLVCIIPPFRDENIREVVAVRLSATSSGRCSEPHTFFYTPVNALPVEATTNNRAAAQSLITNPVFQPENVLIGVQWHVPMQPAASFLSDDLPKNEDKNESEMMPPPASVPPVRRNPAGPSSEIKCETESPPCLAAALHQFVAPDAPLPSLSVENYLSRIESPSQGQVTVSQNQKLSVVEKTDQLLPIEIPELNLAPQPLTPAGDNNRIIMDTKLTGLLRGETDPIITSTDLIYSAPTPQVAVVTPVLLEGSAPVLLEESAPVQEFVTGQNNSTQRPGYDVAANIVLNGHNNSLIYPSENLTVSSSASLQQAFPTLLSESVSLTTFTNPTKNVEEVKSEFQSGILQNISVEENQKPAIMNQVQKKCEEGIPLPQELTQMSEHDLLSYINPSCFDQGNASTFSQFFI